MQHIGRDDDHRPLFDRVAEQFVALARRAAGRGDRRIEPQGLVEHGSGRRQPVGKSLEVAVELALGLGQNPLQPFGRLVKRNRAQVRALAVVS